MDDITDTQNSSYLSLLILAQLNHGLFFEKKKPERGFGPKPEMGILCNLEFRWLWNSSRILIEIFKEGDYGILQESNFDQKSGNLMENWKNLVKFEKFRSEFWFNYMILHYLSI